MIVKKILLAASAATLMSTPAWALPGKMPSNPGTDHAPSTTPVGPPSTTPNNTDNPAAANRSYKGNQGKGQGNQDKGNQGRNHQTNPNKPTPPGQLRKCSPHNVAYVASGTLLSQTLTKNADGTYSGEVTASITHTNHHAIADKGINKAYTVEKVHVTFALKDTNNDGTVGLDDLKEGDMVRLIGKITTLAKRCSQTGFTSTTTIHHIIFHDQQATS